MTFLSMLWSRFAGWIAAASAVIVALIGLYAKGRSDQKAKAELKDLRNANEIRRDGAAARVGADPDRLHDDGWRRD